MKDMWIHHDEKACGRLDHNHTTRGRWSDPHGRTEQVRVRRFPFGHTEGVHSGRIDHATCERGNRAMIQSISPEGKQTLELAREERSLVRRAFAYDLLEGKWLKVDFRDFLSTIDLRVALFLENGLLSDS
jgi:hypothetical protein